MSRLFDELTEGFDALAAERQGKTAVCVMCDKWEKTGRPCTLKSHGECDCPVCQGLCTCYGLPMTVISTVKVPRETFKTLQAAFPGFELSFRVVNSRRIYHARHIESGLHTACIMTTIKSLRSVLESFEEDRSYKSYWRPPDLFPVVFPAKTRI